MISTEKIAETAYGQRTRIYCVVKLLSLDLISVTTDQKSALFRASVSLFREIFTKTALSRALRFSSLLVHFFSLARFGEGLTVSRHLAPERWAFCWPLDRAGTADTLTYTGQLNHIFTFVKLTALSLTNTQYLNS